MRRPYIDWLRGLAVLIMIEWHTVDAWTADGERTSQAFRILAVIGGWAAPLFVFLAGVAVPLAAGAHLRRGRSPEEASRLLQRRGWEVFLYAHLFRLQSYLFNPTAVWHSVLKPDILNILGLGIVAVAMLWGRARSTRGRVWWWVAAIVVILMLTPLARGWAWPALLHPRLEAYIRPNGGYGVFTLLPWVGYMFSGAIVGLWIGQPRDAADEPRFHGQLALAGFGAIVAGLITMQIPSPFEHSSFWSTSASWFTIRSGIMTVALSAAWVWMARPTAACRSPLLVFGRTSLFVYWVHVELAYGVFSQAIKRSLSIPEALTGYLLFTAMMLGLAVWWERRTRSGPWIPPHLRVGTVAP